MGQTLSEPVVEKVCSFLFSFFLNINFSSFFLGLAVTPHCNWSDAILHAVFHNLLGQHHWCSLCFLLFCLFFFFFFPFDPVCVIRERKKFGLASFVPFFHPQLAFASHTHKGPFPSPLPPFLLWETREYVQRK